MEKNCSVCNTVYSAKSSVQVRCAPCQKKHRNSHKRTKYKKTCVDCGAEFNTGNIKAPRCMHCRYNTNCKSCGKEFHRNTSTQKFCFRKCSDRAKKDFYYNGAYSEVMKRDKSTCQKCGDKENLSVHHIDHTGSHKVEMFEANNSLENLIVLCNKCHKTIHALTYKSLAEKYKTDVLLIANEFLRGSQK